MRNKNNSCLLVFPVSLGLLASTAAFASTPLPTFPPAAEQGATQSDEKRYIIKFKKEKYNKNDADDAISQVRGKKVRDLVSRGASVAVLSTKQVQSLRANPLVDFVEEDPVRMLMAEQTPYGIGMVQANLLSDTNAYLIKVCIVDSGYALGHEDLPVNGISGNDGFGSVDSGNWYTDGIGHGTHVAGTITGIGGNGVGVVGVNPSGALGLHIVKVFNESGSWAYGSDLVVAMDQCAAAGAKVVNMSLGGSGSSTFERDAMARHYANGMLLIAAAGNNGTSSLSYPASYDSVMSVAAVDSSGNRASFSQYNAQVEIAAPGVGVLSTLPANQYASWNGTSMATPHVTGAAALVWSQAPNCTARDVRSALTSTAEDRGTAGRDPQYGFGIVKAKAARDALASCSTSTLPTVTTLSNGVPVSNLSGATATQRQFKLSVPAGATDLRISISGGTGDADLYVKQGISPSTSSYDCRPYNSGNDEACTFTAPASGDWFVMLDGYSAYSGVTLVASYQTPVASVSGSGSLTNLSRTKSGWNYYGFDVPVGAKRLIVTTSGGTGNVNLYLRAGLNPTLTAFDCQSVNAGNTESCTVSAPKSGAWKVGLQTPLKYSGVRLDWRYD